MHGSVSEWCQDLYAWRYPADPAVDPVQEGEGWKRVWRGGNRFNDSGDCSAFFCDFARVPPDTPARGFGFRIVRQLPTL